MTTLALEFSSPQRSVAVARDEKVLAEAAETGGRSANAFGLIEHVLADAEIKREQIDVLCVGLGPGSYTGIRGAIAIAQGWHLARGVKLLGVSSVEAIAAQAQAEEIFGRVNVVIDAQRNEFYSAVHKISKLECTEVERLKIVTMAELQSRANEGEILIGPEVTRWFPGKILFPSAARLSEMAAGKTGFIAGEELKPIYLRETDFVKAQSVKL